MVSPPARPLPSHLNAPPPSTFLGSSPPTGSTPPRLPGRSDPRHYAEVEADRWQKEEEVLAGRGSGRRGSRKQRARGEGMREGG